MQADDSCSQRCKGGGKAEQISWDYIPARPLEVVMRSFFAEASRHQARDCIGLHLLVPESWAELKENESFPLFLNRLHHWANDTCGWRRVVWQEADDSKRGRVADLPGS